MTTNHAPAILQPFIESLQVGDPLGHLNLTLVPLRGSRPRMIEYLLAEHAIRDGLLSITEISQAGSVPELLAVNTADGSVLLLDGEELVGAKQNRILNTSILLAGGSKTKIPVSCVEQGRWHHLSAEFSSGHYSPAKLRARKSRDVSRNLAAIGEALSDQGAVWEAVAENVHCLAAATPTMAMHDVYEQRHDDFAAYADVLKYPSNSRGVIVAIDGRFAAMDLLDKPQTLESLWPRLIRGYAMDAIAAYGKKTPPAFTAKGASILLERLGQIPCRAFPSAGIGEDWRFDAHDILGQALVVEGICVHLCAFPGDSDTGDERNMTNILPPSRRRGRRSGPLANPPGDVSHGPE